MQELVVKFKSTRPGRSYGIEYDAVWTYEPPRMRTTFASSWFDLGANKPRRDAWPGMAFCTVYHWRDKRRQRPLMLLAYTAKTAPVDEQSIVMVPLGPGPIVCLGRAAAQSVKSGEQTATEAFWNTTFRDIDPYIGHLKRPAPKDLRRTLRGEVERLLLQAHHRLSD